MEDHRDHLSGDNAAFSAAGISEHVRALKDLSHFIHEAEQPNISLFFCPSPLTDLDPCKEDGNENVTAHKEAARMLTVKDSGWAFRLTGRYINSYGKIASPSITTLTGALFRNTFLADSGASIDIYGEAEETVGIKPVDIIIFSGFLQSKKAGICQRDYKWENS